MRNLPFKILYFMSFICINSVSAMDSKPDFSSLELRNTSKLPATVNIFYNIPGIKEGLTTSSDPVTVNLAPISTDGAQDKKLIPNPKRYGLVSIEVDGGVKFHSVVDLISEILVSSTGKIFHSFNNRYNSPTTDVAPEWLFKSLTFTKFDLSAYGKDLLKKWGNLTDEQKKSPYSYDIPSCMHVIDKLPKMTTPFPLCLRPNMASAALDKYISVHPEINITEEEIQKIEAELISNGLPLLKC